MVEEREQLLNGSTPLHPPLPRVSLGAVIQHVQNSNLLHRGSRRIHRRGADLLIMPRWQRRAKEDNLRSMRLRLNETDSQKGTQFSGVMPL